MITTTRHPWPLRALGQSTSRTWSRATRTIVVLLASVAGAVPVAAQARVKSPIAGAQREVPFAPLIVQLERREANTEVRVERLAFGTSNAPLCDYRRGNVPPVGGVRISCAEVGGGWTLRVLLRSGSNVNVCSGTVTTPTVTAGTPIVLSITRTQDRSAALEFFSCRFAP